MTEHPDEIFFEGDDELVAITDFPFDEIDRNLGFANHEEELSESRERLQKGVIEIFRFIWDDGGTNINGISERAIACCLVAVPEVRCLGVTAVATSCGLAKQSLDRHIQAFKRHFPNAKTSNMQNR